MRVRKTARRRTERPPRATIPPHNALIGFVLFFTQLHGAAPTFDIAPAEALQGQTLRFRAPLEARSAWMNGRNIHLFPQADGGSLGLMPVPAEELPGIYKVHFVDAKGGHLRLMLVTVRDAHYPKQNIAMAKELTGLRLSPGESETSAAFRKIVSETRLWADPLEAPINGCMTSPFGAGRLHNGQLTGDYHGGIDQRGLEGTPVRAVAAGVVKVVQKWNLHGNTVGIDHGQGLESMYLHMSLFATQEGAEVRQGDVIGYVGSTGRSTGPHLHWSLYVNSVPVNPQQWVALSPCGLKKLAARKKPAR